MSSGIVRINLERASEFRFGFGPLPLLLVRGCQQDVRFGKFRVQLQGFSSGIHHFRSLGFWGSAHENCSEFRMRACEADIGWRKSWVLPYCLFEIRQAFVDIGSTIALAQSESAFKVTLVD